MDRFFEKRIKQLRKDFQKNVRGEISRRMFHETRSQKARRKHRKALKKQRRAELRAIERRRAYMRALKG